MRYYIPYFAQAYGEGAYGANTYSCSQTQIDAGTCVAGAGTGGGSGTGAGGTGGGLANTGFSIVLIMTLACLIVFVSLLVRMWRRQKPALQEQEVITPSSSLDSSESQDM